MPRSALDDAHLRHAPLNVQQHRPEEMSLTLEVCHYSSREECHYSTKNV